LVKAITPPAVGWEKSLKEAYEMGALEAITDVLKLHAGNEDVTAAATAALTAIAADGSYASAVVETGALMSLVGSLVANPGLKKGVKETIALFEKVATTAPKAVLAVGGVDAATRLIELAPHEKDIAPPCLRVLEHLVKEPEGAEMIVECESLKQIFSLLCATKDAELLEGSLRVLDRVSKSGEYAEIIRSKHNGLQVLCTVLSQQDTGSKVSVLGGRLLAKLASTNVSDLVSKMLSSSSPTEKEFMASLLASLALESEYGERILASGGLPALSQVLGSSNAKTSEAAARAISRLVTTEEHAQALLDGDIVSRLVGLLDGTKEGGGDTLAASIASALGRLASRSPACAAKVWNGGGVDSLLRYLNANPQAQAFATFALNTVEDLMTLTPPGGPGGVADAPMSSLPPATRGGGYPWTDPGVLVGMGVIPGVAGALKSHAAHPLIQLNGSRILVYLSSTEANVGAMVAGGVVPSALNNVAVPSGDDTATAAAGTGAGSSYVEPSPELVATSMYLLTQFSLTSAGKEAIGSPGADVIMSAVSHFTRTMGALGEECAMGSISVVAEELMLSTVSEKQVLSTLMELKKLTDSACDTRSKGEVRKLRALATNLAAFAATPQFAEAMLRSGALEALLYTINAVAGAQGLPDAERVLISCAGALQGTVRGAEAGGGSSAAAIAALAEANGGKLLSDAIKAAPRMLKFAGEAMGLLAYMSQNESVGDAIASTDGGVDACSAVLRSNPVNAAAISSDAIATLLALASTDKGAASVAKLGGTRQVITSMHANVGDATFARAALPRAINLLSVIASSPEGGELLVRQGGVDAMVEAAAEMERYGGGEEGGVGAAQAQETLDALIGSLGKLMGVEEVKRVGESVKALATLASSRDPSAITTEALRAALIKAPVIAAVPAFADIFSSAGVPAALLTLNAQLLQPSCDAATASVGLEMTFKTLASLFRTSSTMAGCDKAPLLAQARAALSAGIALTPCLEFIKQVTQGDEATARSLALDGTTLPLIASTLRAHMTDKEVSGAGFRAMAALGGHASTASALVSTPALSLAQEWLLDNAAEAAEESVGAALSVLASLASGGGVGGAAVESGVLDTVKKVLSLRCGDGGEGEVGSLPAAPTVMASSLRVLTAVAGKEGGAEKIGAGGFVRRAVAALSSNSKAYLSSEATSLGLCKFINSMAAANGGGGGAEVGDRGVELVLEAMTLNFSSPSVLEAGSSALEALGGGAEAARLALAELTSLNAAARAAAAAGQEDEGTLQGLGDAAVRLSNLAGVEGVVSSTSADGLVAALTDTLELLTASSAPPQGATLAHTMAALGRLMELGGEGADASSTRAVAALCAALASRRAATIPIRSAGVHALGQAASSRSGAGAVIKAGGIKIVRDVAKKHHADVKLASLAGAAIKRISTAATRWASSSLTTPEGLASLASLLNAHAADPEGLAGVLSDIIKSPGGGEALMAVIGMKTLGSDVLCATLGAVAEEGDGKSKVVCTPGRVSALIAAIEAALALQATLTQRSDGKCKWRAFKTSQDALKVLQRTRWCPKTAAKFLDAGGGGILMQVLAANRGDPETVAAVCAIVKDLSSSGAPMEDLNVLLPHVRLMADTLRDAISAAMDPEVAADALDAIINLTARVPSEERAPYEKEVLRCSTLLAKMYPGNARVLGAIRALEAAWGAKISDTGDAEKFFGVSVSKLRALFERAGKWQEILGGDGRPYYFNKDTGETLWECPPDLLAAKIALKQLAEAASVMGEDATVSDCDPLTIAELIKALEMHARSPDLAGPIATTLSTLATNPDNAMKIVEAEGILAAAKVASSLPDNLDFLRIALKLMERCSLVEECRFPVAEKGGLDLIILVAIGRHCAVPDITILALTVMANLATDFDVGDLTMKKKGVKSVEKALQEYKNGPRVLEPAMSVLSNLMYGNEGNKLEIGQTCGDEITGVVRDHHKDVSLTKMALRALGNLTFCMDNVRFVVEDHGMTKAVVLAMRANAQDEELQSLSMNVLSNCAACEEPAPELDENGDLVGDLPDSISLIILRDAGCSQVISCLKRFRNVPQLILDALSCLINLSDDAEVAEKMVKKQGLLREVLDILDMYTMDVEILRTCMQLLGALSFSRGCIQPILDADFFPLILSHMEAHGEEENLLWGGQQAIANLMCLVEGRNAVRDQNAIPRLFGLLERCLSSEGYVKEMMTTIMRLCAEDEMSVLMVSYMHVLMAVIQFYDENPKVLIFAFRALSSLAMIKSNLTSIVQHNGIKKIIDAITVHPDNKDLMKSCIQSLDNITMASSENATIVIDEGGKELLELVMESHKDSPEIQRNGKSALLSLSALEGLSRSKAITERAARNKARGTSEKEDPLKEFRNLLGAGKIFKVWQSGSSRAAHVVMSADFRSVVWQEVGSTRKLGALDLRSVLSIRSGSESKNFKRGVLGAMSKPVNNDLAFSLVGDHNNLDLEADTVPTRDKWIKAFNAVLNVFKADPGALAPP